jgi:hypothetical protein
MSPSTVLKILQIESYIIGEFSVLNTSKKQNKTSIES